MITIDGYAIDCAVSETHTSDNEATEYNIEQPEPGKEGSVMTDHVRSKPRELVLEGLVTDTPIGRMVAVRGSESPDETLETTLTRAIGAPDVQHSAVAFQKLQDLADSHRPVTVITSARTYRGVVMTNLVVTKNKDTWGRLPFTATFRKFVFVSIGRNQVVRVGSPSATGVAGLGDKSKNAPLAYGTFCDDRNEQTGQCRHQIVVERRADGKWYTPGGRVPSISKDGGGKELTKDQLDDWALDQKGVRDRTAEYDKAQGTWVDRRTGRPISTMPDRAYWKPDSASAEPAQPGQTGNAVWDDLEFLRTGSRR